MPTPILHIGDQIIDLNDADAFVVLILTDVENTTESINRELYANLRINNAFAGMRLLLEFALAFQRRARANDDKDTAAAVDRVVAAIHSAAASVGVDLAETSKQLPPDDIIIAKKTN